MHAAFSEAAPLPEKRNLYDSERLRNLFEEDASALRELDYRRIEIQEACADNPNAWALALFPLRDSYYVFLRMQRAAAEGWQATVRVADMGQGKGHAPHLDAAALFQEHPRLQQQIGEDGVFLRRLRTGVCLCTLDAVSQVVALVPADRTRLAESLLSDAFVNAMPAGRRRYISAVCGTAALPASAYRLHIRATEEPSAHAAAVSADFTLAPPTLRSRFPELNFAQRTAKELLAMLDLPFYLSMFDAAEKFVTEKIGAVHAQNAQDLITWQMLRKNFPLQSFSITEAEMQALRPKAYKLAA
ncbi:MAG: hypothetical protein LBR73_04720 [Oscillospiraceae bacterium]|jgi:hypothetical protein|nr:hypothetical protein [Oscillospiraceae bacterium]